MSTDLVLLAALMAAVTYPARALPLLAPGIERLSPRARLYLRLVGPAILASVGAVNTLVGSTADGAPVPRFGVEVAAVVACIALTAWRRNLVLGLAVAVLLVAGARGVGLG